MEIKDYGWHVRLKEVGRIQANVIEAPLENVILTTNETFYYDYIDVLLEGKKIFSFGVSQISNYGEVNLYPDWQNILLRKVVVNKDCKDVLKFAMKSIKSEIEDTIKELSKIKEMIEGL